MHLKILTALFCYYFLIICFAQSWAQVDFLEDFDSPELSPEWQIWTWDGEPWSYHVPSSYTLTEHPGFLRFKLGAMVASIDVPDLYQYWYYPSPHLWRRFNGTNWVIEFKVTFYLPYSNAKHFKFEIFYGDLFHHEYGILINKGIDQINRSHPPYHFRVNVCQKGESTCSWFGADEALRTQMFQTYFFRIFRLKTDFIIEWSTDGSNFQVAEIITLDDEINYLPQAIQIFGKSWFTPSGAYADFDYIRVISLDGEPRAFSNSAIGNFLESPSLFLQSVGEFDENYLEKFDKYFPIIAIFENKPEENKKREIKISRQNRNESLADIYLQELKYYQSLEKKTEEILGQIFLDYNKAHFISSRKWIYDRLVEICARLHELEADKGYDLLAFFYAEKIKSLGMLQMIASYKATTKIGVQDSLSEVEAAMIKKLADLVNKNSQVQGSIDEKYKIWEQIHTLYVKWGEIKNDKRRLAYERQLIQKVKLPSMQEIKSELIDDDSVILSYYFCGSELFIFLLDNVSLKIVECKNALKISHYVKFYYDLISQYSAFDNFEQAGKNVFSQIIAPVFNEIKDKKNLIIVPDSVLCHLPFESLLIQTHRENPKNEFLGMKYNISYAMSASILMALQKRLEKNSHQMNLDFFAMFAFPEGDVPATVVDQNSSSGPFLQEIAALFPSKKSKVFRGEAATEDVLKCEDGIRSRIFHLAAHCCLDQNSVWSPRMFLHYADFSDEDGILELAEVFNLNLQTEVAVLAGCRTGRGMLFRSGGMYNFSRAFLSVGAASTIVSLWDVENQSTTLLMKYFYLHFLSGASKSLALRQARCDLFQYKNGKYSHPFFWSPFVLIGDFH